MKFAISGLLLLLAVIGFYFYGDKASKPQRLSLGSLPQNKETLNEEEGGNLSVSVENINQLSNEGTAVDEEAKLQSGSSAQGTGNSETERSLQSFRNLAASGTTQAEYMSLEDQAQRALEVGYITPEQVSEFKLQRKAASEFEEQQSEMLLSELIEVPGNESNN